MEILEDLLDNGLSGVDPAARDLFGEMPADVFERSEKLGGVDDETREAFYALLDTATSCDRIQEV